jgi:hypothetical protein
MSQFESKQMSVEIVLLAQCCRYSCADGNFDVSFARTPSAQQTANVTVIAATSEQGLPVE